MLDFVSHTLYSCGFATLPLCSKCRSIVVHFGYICHFTLYTYLGIWLQKVLSDMMGKATGNQTLADKKVFLYSAVSWWAGGCQWTNTD